MEFRSVRGLEERRSVKALLRTEFEVSPGVGAAFGRLYDDLLDRDDSIGEGRSWVAVEKGRIVGHALYGFRSLRIAGCDVAGALIGMVVVAPAFRGKGIGGSLIGCLEEAARSEGCLVVQLAGDLGYYSRFGYVDGYVDGVQTLEPASRRPTGFRDAVASDIDRLTRWSLAHVPAGAVVPSDRRWRWLLETGHPGGLTGTNERMVGFRSTEDRVIVSDDGYASFAAGDGVFVVYEAGADHPDRLLDDLRAYAAEFGVPRLELRLPSRHPVAMAWERGRSSPNPEFLVKSLDTAALFERVRTEIDSRLAGVEEPGPVVTLSIGSFSLRIGRSLEVTTSDEGHDGEGDRIYVPEIGLIRALLGRDSVADMVQRRGGGARSVSLLRVGFPPGEPFFWLADAI